MSFDTCNNVVKEGDTVFLYLGKRKLSNDFNALEINSTQTFQSRYGAFHHRDIIGQKYGTKVRSKKGWGYILRATPELWTVTLPHRTQILYTMDISMITFELELKPGSVVVEAGTGSGSLSHAMIRTIKPNGHLYTFDFHQTRVLKAKEEFSKHFSADYVTSACADVCKDGFSVTNKADAVFLDLPTPWNAIPHAKNALKKSGGRLCSFSPCIEQVQRTCEALKKNGFCEVRTMECLVRSLNILTVQFPKMNFEIEGLDELLEEENESDAKKPKMENDNEDPVIISKNNETHPDTMKEAADLHLDNTNGEEKANNDTSSDIEGESDLVGKVTRTMAQSKKGKVCISTCKPPQEVTGHTGYLTFASLLPDFVKGLN